MAACCLKPANWKSVPHPKRLGWIRTVCGVCKRWIGDAPQDIKAYRRKK